MQLLETLLPLSDLAARVNIAVDLITSSHKNISRDLLHFAATTFYYKLKAADSYVPATKYHGNVTLLRAKTSSDYEQNLGADYKLNEVPYLTILTHICARFKMFFCMSMYVYLYVCVCVCIYVCKYL